jgi:hypothetical protein
MTEMQRSHSEKRPPVGSAPAARSGIAALSICTGIGLVVAALLSIPLGYVIHLSYLVLSLIVFLFGPLVGLALAMLYLAARWALCKRRARKGRIEAPRHVIPSITRKICLALAFLYLMLFATLAVYDEKPDAQLAREMSQKQSEVLEPGNGWLFLLGFGSPEGTSSYASGAEQVTAVKKAIAAGKHPEYLPNSVASKAPFRGTMPSFYSKNEGGILHYVRAHGHEAAALSRSNQSLLLRYQSLLTYPRYTEDLDLGYAMPIPHIAGLLNAQKAALLEMGRAVVRGDVTGALASLHADAEYWRFVSRSSESLVSKLMAMRTLSIDFQFAAEIGTIIHLENNDLEVIHDVLRTFRPGEASMAVALRGEARSAVRGMSLSTQPLEKEQRLFCKPNATKNRLYTDYKEFVRCAQLTPPQFAREIKEGRSVEVEPSRVGLAFLYNPAGEILAGIVRPTVRGFIEKGHNLEGLRRLALLKVLCHQEDVPAEKMQQFMAAHSVDLGNPYTGAPMQYDHQKKKIFFPSVSPGKTVEISM